MAITQKTFSVLILLLSLFALSTAIECSEIRTQELVSEEPQQKTIYQEVKYIVSKTIDFTLLFGTASGLITAVISRCEDDYTTNQRMQDNFKASLLVSALCATAYVIKKKCI